MKNVKMIAVAVSVFALSVLAGLAVPTPEAHASNDKSPTVFVDAPQSVPFAFEGTPENIIEATPVLIVSGRPSAKKVAPKPVVRPAAHQIRIRELAQQGSPNAPYVVCID